MSTTPAHALNGIVVSRWGSGRPLVMVHGGGQGHLAAGQEKWRHQRPLSDDGWEMILPDRPGSGSTPSRGPEDFVNDAPWLVELLGDGADLVAHSYGAAIALCAAGLAPEKVRSLTLIEPPVLSTAMHVPAAREMAENVHAAAQSRFATIGLLRAFKLLGIPRGAEPRPSLGEVRAMAKGFQTMRQPYLWDAFESIERVKGARIPALLVTGGWSPAMEANADQLAKLLSGERLVIQAGHHFPHIIDDGAQFNAAFTRFTDGVAAKRPG